MVPSAATRNDESLAALSGPPSDLDAVARGFCKGDTEPGRVRSKIARDRRPFSLVEPAADFGLAMTRGD